MVLGRFLVVDDMEPSRRTIVRFLKAAGEIDVLQAGSRLEALQVLGQHDAWTDLVVDADLADGDGGIRFLKEARRRFPHLRALLITAHEDPIFPVQAYWLQATFLRLDDLAMDILPNWARCALKPDGAEERIRYAVSVVSGKHHLTPAQREVLEPFCLALSFKQIAASRHNSYQTVLTHSRKIVSTFEASDLQQVARMVYVEAFRSDPVDELRKAG